MSQKNTVIIIVVVVVLALLVVGVYMFYPQVFKFMQLSPTAIEKDKPKVIEENLVIPQTEKIIGSEGRTIEEGDVEVLLVPKNEGEKVIVSKAVLTVKGAYDLALVEAKKWSLDTKLVFVKSLGAVTLEGKSSQWQLAFSSATQKDKGYEVIIQADQIVSKKEIDSAAVGADLPINLKDSAEAIKVLQELPQFSRATLSAISLYYNTDGKVWRYTLSTSNGGTSVAAQ
ncbi:MAG: hypothetical protein US79_C0007G0002 [Parcubacteria group bacterium GW2011_GWC1_38_17]|nr:MAG: hypothetical protein US06_C0009G0029 [Parcubacteria group bacterium GW2011_GWC2_36_17]KKQ58436.1 MAG: hypothetical protein US79_C0007G0002 [Parcubacteria group bacterium GW2011_GWC1_38_17]